MIEKPILFSAPMVRALLAGTKTQTRRLVDPERLRVRLDAPVTSDHLPGVSDIAAKAGKHWARMNPHGAVSLKLKAGALGVKPGEFHIECPYVDGTTVLADRGALGRAWTVIPSKSSQLWVRETWYCDDYTAPSFEKARVGYVGTPPTDAEIIEKWKCDMYFRADAKETGTVCELIPECQCDGQSPWKPGIHMPRWASRISLAVASARIERLHAITEADARAEGVTPFFDLFPEIGRDQRVTTGELARDAEHRASFAVLWDELNGERALWKSNPWVWCVEFSVVEEKA